MAQFRLCYFCVAPNAEQCLLAWLNFAVFDHNAKLFEINKYHGLTRNVVVLFLSNGVRPRHDAADVDVPHDATAGYTGDVGGLLQDTCP